MLEFLRAGCCPQQARTVFSSILGPVIGRCWQRAGGQADFGAWKGTRSAIERDSEDERPPGRWPVGRSGRLPAPDCTEKDSSQRRRRGPDCRSPENKIGLRAGQAAVIPATLKGAGGGTSTPSSLTRSHVSENRSPCGRAASVPTLSVICCRGCGPGSVRPERESRDTAPTTPAILMGWTWWWGERPHRRGAAGGRHRRGDQSWPGRGGPRPFVRHQGPRHGFVRAGRSLRGVYGQPLPTTAVGHRTAGGLSAQPGPAPPASRSGYSSSISRDSGAQLNRWPDSPTKWPT